jgi:hypothetical protein
VTSVEGTQGISNVQAAYEFANRENLINTDSFHLSYISAVYCDCNDFIIRCTPNQELCIYKRHSDITAADLRHQWRFGIKQAQDTLDTATQRFSRSILLPISQRYRNNRMFY